MGEVLVVKQADDSFEFPVALGLVVPKMPNHVYTDLDTSYNDFQVPGRRLPRRVDGEIIQSRGLARVPFRSLLKLT